MRCTHCQHEDAQIHIEYISNHQKTEYHLCPACFQKLKAEGWHQPSSALGSGSPIAGEAKEAGGKDAWIKALLAMEGDSKPRTAQSAEPVCEVCGMTWADFQHKGLLGCAHCYEVFDAYMPNLLRKLHGHAQHVGKQPQGTDTPAAAPNPIEDLRVQLKEALSREAYEEAAILRDRIIALEQDAVEGDVPYAE